MGARDAVPVNRGLAVHEIFLPFLFPSILDRLSTRLVFSSAYGTGALPETECSSLSGGRIAVETEAFDFMHPSAHMGCPIPDYTASVAFTYVY